MSYAILALALALPTQCPGGQCPIPSRPAFVAPAPQVAAATPLVVAAPRYVAAPVVVYARPVVANRWFRRPGLFGVRLRGGCR